MADTPKTRAQLLVEWIQEHGEHTECPVCGSQCRDEFVGDTLTALQKAAPALFSALVELLDIVPFARDQQVEEIHSRASKAIREAVERG